MAPLPAAAAPRLSALLLPFCFALFFSFTGFHCCGDQVHSGVFGLHKDSTAHFLEKLVIILPSVLGADLNTLHTLYPLCHGYSNSPTS